jgi:hypothetical protein
MITMRQLAGKIAQDCYMLNALEMPWLYTELLYTDNYYEVRYIVDRRYTIKENIYEYDCKILSAHIFDDDGKYVKDIEDKEDLRIRLQDTISSYL